MFFVAAHATVARQLPDGTWQSETSWALEAPFAWLTGADSWAQYFQVNTSACAAPTDPPVSAPNRKPVANPDSYVTKADTTLSIPAPGLLANDSDPDGDALSVFLTQPIVTIITNAGGFITIRKDGSFEYAPPAGFTGTDATLYAATDGALESLVAKVSIQVTKNDPVVTPPAPAVATCYQCSGLDCLLNPKNDVCAPGQDLCYTEVSEKGNVRTIIRDCGSRTDTPAPAVPSDTCRSVETQLLGDGSSCKFYCDGVTNTGCNVPPTLIPAQDKGRVPDWQ